MFNCTPPCLVGGIVTTEGGVDPMGTVHMDCTGVHRGTELGAQSPIPQSCCLSLMRKSLYFYELQFPSLENIFIVGVIVWTNIAVFSMFKPVCGWTYKSNTESPVKVALLS